MAGRSLAPERRHGGWPRSVRGDDLFSALCRKLNELFDDLYCGLEFLEEPRPRVEVTETDEAVTLKAHLPAMAQRDFSLSSAENTMLNSGELTLKLTKPAKARKSKKTDAPVA